jgi:hypothetical protein
MIALGHLHLKSPILIVCNTYNFLLSKYSEEAAVYRSREQCAKISSQKGKCIVCAKK